MDPLFTVILAVLAALAVTGLVVGVSNDASNFLNSAIGSKAAPRYIIMAVASVGIILGSLFSSGMMEVARSGMFYPQMFTFHDVMLLFLTVMLTNVILLDLFNTMGLPTSTTVSLVFELLGSAVAVACMKIWSQEEGASQLPYYINATNALGIISGILLSVVVAFVCGSIVMYVTRVIFSFRYRRTFRYFGSVWCGLALTAISYFALFKGVKGTTIISPETMRMLEDNLWTVVGVMIVGWTLIMAVVQNIFKVNILKITVLAGTFSLALAFAGNDLVNFIGVFMAGFDSYNMALQSGDMNMMMGGLAGPAHTNMVILFIAGVIMTLTLWFSKKAQHVTDTEVNLARQESAGAERFGSTFISRSIVRWAVDVNRKVEKVTPKRVQRNLSSRFVPSRNNDGAPFDLIRATVNLTVASLLISTATSLRLPLSTTYVTFMVAMGSSLADKAWGRESAVYRVTGVLTVISGWFLTVFIAFTIAFVVALILVAGGTIAIVAMTLLCAFILVQNNIVHKNRKDNKDGEVADSDLKLDKDIVDACRKEICQTMQKVITVYDSTLTGIFTEDRKLLKNMVRESETLYEEAHRRKYAVYNTLSTLSENYISTGHYYVQVVDYVNEVTKALVHITRPGFNHIDNNHSGFSQDQITDLKEIEEKVSIIYGMINHMLKEDDYSKLDQTLLLRDSLFEEFAQVIKRQIARIKTGDTSTRTSMLYLDIISETKTMVLQSRNLLKAQKHFVSK